MRIRLSENKELLFMIAQRKNHSGFVNSLVAKAEAVEALCIAQGQTIMMILMKRIEILMKMPILPLETAMIASLVVI